MQNPVYRCDPRKNSLAIVKGWYLRCVPVQDCARAYTLIATLHDVMTICYAGMNVRAYRVRQCAGAGRRDIVLALALAIHVQVTLAQG